MASPVARRPTRLALAMVVPPEGRPPADARRINAWLREHGRDVPYAAFYPWTAA